MNPRPDGDKAAELLFALARLQPAPGAVARSAALLREPASPAADRLVRLARAGGVAPLLYRHLAAAGGIPRETLLALGAPYFGNIRWNRECLGETAAILAALRSAGVAAMPLKGAVAALGLLGDEGLYAGGDIDVLVRPGDLAGAIAVLQGLGYVSGPVALADDLAASYHHALVRGRFWVELHWNLVELPFVADPAFWWEGAVFGETSAGPAWVPAPERLLLALIRRLHAHGFSPLRLFVLPVAVAGGAAGPIEWDRFPAAARRCRMERVSRFALALMKDLLGADVPEALAAPGRARRRLGARVVRALAGGPPVRQLTRVRLLALGDSAGLALRTAARKLVPPAAEIRWRYGEAARGWRLPLLYLLNPLLALVDPAARGRLAGGARGRRSPWVVPQGEGGLE